MRASPERLHVTNGDAAAERILEAGIGGVVLPWRDVLHEGPVPAGLALDALTEVRARFIVGAGWDAPDEALAQFRWRDATLAGFRAYAEVILWFEHDLYDQLQLLQVLDWFNGAEPGAGRLSLINPAEYLGSSDPERLRTLFAARVEVTDDAKRVASTAWGEFRSPDPRPLADRALVDCPAMPHLRPALHRLLQEYPGVGDGLSRTERQALRALQGGARSLGSLFRAAHHECEDPVFLGDLVFEEIVVRLTRATVALARFEAPGASHVELTAAGRDALAGKLDHVEVNGVDRWIGGVHLKGRSVPWRWSPEASSLVSCN